MDRMSLEQRKSVLRAYRRRHMARLNKINRGMELRKIGPQYRKLLRLLYTYRGMPLTVNYIRKHVVLGGYSTRQDRSTQLGSFHHAIRSLRQFLKGSEWEIRLFKEPGQKQAYGYGLYRVNSVHSVPWCNPHGNHTARVMTDADRDIKVPEV